MDISIIIPTFNNSKLLKKTFDNIEKTIKGNFLYEIIVVNNNSTDNTDEIIKEYSNNLSVKSFFQSKQGISVAKNTGIINSTGKLVVFTDDDVRPNVNWLNAYWDAYCKNPDRYFWGGSIVSEFESNPPSEQLLKYAPPSVRGMDLGPCERILSNDEFFVGASWACTRKALDDVGLFNTELGLNPLKKVVMVGEETELMERLISNGYKALYLPNATVHHFVPTPKTTLKHIADRNEAFGYYCEFKNYNELFKYKTQKWVYRSFVENFIKYKFLKLIGKDTTDEYINFKTAKGIIRAAIACKFSSIG